VPREQLHAHVRLWKVVDGKLVVAPVVKGMTNHYHFGMGEAYGRIDGDRGSIIFQTSNRRQRKDIVNQLLAEFPNIAWYVSEPRAGLQSLKQWWELEFG
jgi:hypothetical protein